MVSDEQVERHLETVRGLSKVGRPLAPNAATATIDNPTWWIDGEPTPSRDRLHRRLLSQAREARPGVKQQRRAIVLAGPPGAGKGWIRGKLLGADGDDFLVIDADDFKGALLREALSDGSYDSWLMPDEVRELGRNGHQFYPLELAALVHEESSYLAKALRSDAIEAGDNIVIDAVLADSDKAVALGEQLAGAGYEVWVIDVEVSRDVSEERIRQRWRSAYLDACAGRDPLGGRWVPSEYASEVFDGPAGLSRPAHAARRLADECTAVRLYRMYNTEHAADAPVLTLVRVNAGGPLVELDEDADIATAVRSSPYWTGDR
ncbi:MAG: zeta toxin family protein [Acidimicrobiales bacterium]